MHLWLGLITGAFICLMGFTGGLVGLRPQIATALSPPAARVATCTPTDWNRAAAEITTFAHAEINRVYGPYDADPRWHIRMATDDPIIFNHVIYDACAGRVLGTISYHWMDWTVDLHHNLLSGRTGRRWAGAIGIVMMISGFSGLVLWLLSNPSLFTAFHIHIGFTQRTPRELHRAFGLGATLFLLLECVTGAGLAFPQTQRAVVAAIAPVTEDVRPARAGSNAPEGGHASLGDLMAAAHSAVPDGLVREIRMPEGNGNAAIRMWRPGDFRILGNNVAYVSGSTGKVLAVDRYSERPAGNRFIQAMAGLHYDEWGGLPFRLLCCMAGLATPLLYLTGFLIWWNSRKRKPAPTSARAVADGVHASAR